MQQRFILFIVVSVLIFVGWNHFFPVKNAIPANTNNANSAAVQSTPSPQQSPQTQAPAPTAPVQAAQPSTTDNVQHREVSVETPLYKVKFDNRGAVATSWIVTRDKTNGRQLYSVKSTKGNPVPLELISQVGENPASVGLSDDKRETPLRLVTGDNAIDAALSTRNYSVSGLDAAASTLTVGAGESKTLEFSMNDPATGLTVSRKLTFSGDFYNVLLNTVVTRNGQPVPQVRLAVGPSIGDQGVPKFTFYSYAPEGVASANAAVTRVAAKSVNESKTTPDKQDVPGVLDWAGVGDTYFAMVAVPSKTDSGLEYKTTKYDYSLADGKKETRYLITGYVPIPTDGSTTAIYVGPKDHEIIATANAQISSELHRTIDLDGLFNYGWFAVVKRGLAYPILATINWFQKITGSYGLAIILFTILLYSLFFPLKWRSSKSMKKAQKLAPRMKELQAAIKGMKQTDPRLKDLQKEQLMLMKEGNPLGGCLPLLIQMPFLFALYSAITVSIDFRQSSFLWMPDLSAGDPWHFLEILMAASMIVLQLVTPAPSADPAQRKMMAFTMPVIMLYILWGAPSGLLVYWLVGNVVGFSQQFLINYLSKSDEDDMNTPEKPADKSKTKKLNAPRVSPA